MVACGDNAKSTLAESIQLIGLATKIAAYGDSLHWGDILSCDVLATCDMLGFTRKQNLTGRCWLVVEGGLWICGNGHVR
jgi:hypothetical protein